MKLLKLVSRFSGVLVLCGPTALAAAGEVKLTIPQGDIVGDQSADGSVASFNGLPYAIPPTGDRRWTAAEVAPA